MVELDVGFWRWRRGGFKKARKPLTPEQGRGQQESCGEPESGVPEHGSRGVGQREQRVDDFDRCGLPELIHAQCQHGLVQGFLQSHPHLIALSRGLLGVKRPTLDEHQVDTFRSFAEGKRLLDGEPQSSFAEF